VALCGGLAGDWRALLEGGLTAAFSVVDGPRSLEEAQGDAAALVERAAEQVVRLVGASVNRGARVG